MAQNPKTKELCSICREQLATNKAEVLPGRLLFVCDKCRDMAKQNFIWICMHCGSVHFRPKSVVRVLLSDPVLKQAYDDCREEQLIQGIDRCMDCDPESMTDSAAAALWVNKECHC